MSTSKPEAALDEIAHLIESADYHPDLSSSRDDELLKEIYPIAKARQLNDLEERLKHELDEAQQKAWDSLSRYKFQMFGYWAAIWVHLNRIGDFKRPNPWARLVKQARHQSAASAEKTRAP